jgi:hypothetical protein
MHVLSIIIRDMFQLIENLIDFFVSFSMIKKYRKGFYKDKKRFDEFERFKLQDNYSR